MFKRADQTARPTKRLFASASFEFFALLFENGFAAQFDFVAFEGEHLHENLIAFVQLVADVFDAAYVRSQQSERKSLLTPRIRREESWKTNRSVKS